MSSFEFPPLPQNVSYISLDGTPVNDDSPFPEVRFANEEDVDASEELTFDYMRAGLIAHYRNHICDIRNGLYDHRWPEDKIEVNRAEAIASYRHEIKYLLLLKDDDEGRAYIELWYHKLNPRQETSVS